MVDEVLENKEELVETVEEVTEPKLDIAKLIEDKLKSFKEETNNELNSLKEMLKAKEEELSEYKNVIEKKTEDTELKEVFEKRKTMEEQRKSEEEKTRYENAIKENNMLKLQNKVNDFIKKHPYLEDILSEKIQEGTITSVKQLETEFSPTLLKRLKEAEELKALYVKNFGKDPLGEYTVNPDVKAKIKEEQERKEAREEMLRRLNI